jgi:hypothetical protein
MKKECSARFEASYCKWGADPIPEPDLDPVKNFRSPVQINILLHFLLECNFDDIQVQEQFDFYLS